jgi:hypothetical protein
MEYDSSALHKIAQDLLELNQMVALFYVGYSITLLNNSYIDACP